MMKDVTLNSLTPDEQLFLEKALAAFRQTKQVAEQASEGNVINAIESYIVEDGRKILGEMFQGVLESTVEETEKEGDKSCPKCGKKMRNRGRKKKRIVTAVGVITYSRSHYECMPCHYSEFYADRSIAKDVTTTTTGGRNLIALAGGSWGYESATRYLKTFTGIVVSKNTVRAITQQAGKLANKWQLASPHAAQKFIEAKGVQEMLTDGTMVNTQKGWKEVRLTLFSKRLTGTVADYTMMNDRLLPAPGVTFCFGRMESAKKCVSRWSSLAKHLRIHNFQNLHVLADGAKWIWNGAEKTFPNHDGCLDFYHACEHLHEAASNFCKDEKQVRELYETWRTSLAKNGWEGLKKEFLQMKENLSKHRWKK